MWKSTKMIYVIMIQKSNIFQWSDFRITCIKYRNHAYDSMFYNVYERIKTQEQNKCPKIKISS